MTSTDPTQIDAIDVMAATIVVSEVGWDRGKWKTQDHFVFWLKLCPDNKTSGGKIIGQDRMPTSSKLLQRLKNTNGSFAREFLETFFNKSESSWPVRESFLRRRSGSA
jgi:hypothetical protein